MTVPDRVLLLFWQAFTKTQQDDPRSRFLHENKPLPAHGDLSIITDFAGEPLCVIKTQRVDIVTFEGVSAEFAATEEGDGSLEYWRRAHEAIFVRECERIGRQPSSSMPVVCERFEVVFRRVVEQ